MCLSYLRTDKATEKYIAKLPVRTDGYIWLWKCFDVDRKDRLRSQYELTSLLFYEGVNTCKQRPVSVFYSNEQTYLSGFHCFPTNRDAEKWCKEYRDSLIVPVKVKEKWITSTGRQSGMNVVVCNKIFI